MAGSLIIRGAESIYITGDFNPGDMVITKDSVVEQEIIDLDFDMWISTRKVNWILSNGEVYEEKDITLVKKA